MVNRVKVFTPLRTSDESLNRIQNQLRTFSLALADIPILNGRLISDVAIGTSATEVEHGLEREPAGWIVVDIDTAATIYSTPSSLPKRFLTLTASSASTISLWVF